jgi:cytochrome b561
MDPDGPFSWPRAALYREIMLEKTMIDLLGEPAINRYTGPAIALHWLVDMLIIGGFWLGLVMTDIPGLTPTKLRYYSWHKWIGVTVFALVVLRILWRRANPAPVLPAGVPTWQHNMSHVVHGLLYVLMVVIPLSGYLYSSAAGIQVVYLGLLPLPTLIGPDPQLKAMLRLLHVSLNYMLLALFVLHLLGVAKHTWIDRDRLLGRMVPFIK